MSKPVIVSAVRTAQGRFGGSLSRLSAVDLGKNAIKGVFEDLGYKPGVSEKIKSYAPDRTGLDGKTDLEKKYDDWDDDIESLNIDEVIMGNVLQGGQGQNPARQASVRSGVPLQVPAYTVNKVCASGMKSVSLAAEKISIGKTDAVVAGGMESMSSAPFTLPKARWGYRMAVDSQADMKDMMVYDGLYEIFYDYHMGMTAENLAEKYDISREEQDRLSVESQNRALRATKKGYFDDEIIPVEVKGKTVDTDECPRETDMDKMAKLPPVFKKDGTVTAGNASGISDGAAALLITSEEYADEHGLNIMASVEGYTSAGIDPQYMGLGPVPATRRILDETGYDKSDIDVIEENEAFASQILACMDELGTPKYGIDMTEPGGEKVNPNGSGISLGHPIGCTGARIIVSLAHEMKRTGDEIGLATLCIGGGMGMATLIKNI